MTIQHLLAQAAVSDLARAERWYSALFDRQPDAGPMDGLTEWHLSHIPAALDAIGHG